MYSASFFHSRSICDFACKLLVNCAICALVVILPKKTFAADFRDHLLDIGPHPIGFTETLVTSGSRRVEFLVWYPAEPDSDASFASYPLRVPVPVLGLFEFPFQIDSELVSAAIQADVPPNPSPHEPLSTASVYGNVDSLPGPWPALVHLPGGNSPAFPHIYEGMKYASHGIIFVSIAFSYSDLNDGFCDLSFLAEGVLDTLQDWNRDPSHLLFESVNEEAIFGSGFSMGARTWFGRTSAETECGLEPEDRLAGLFLKEPTREALTSDQIESNFLETVLNSQYCRDTQIDLHENLSSRPQMLMYEGVTVEPSSENHNLFAQNCIVIAANLLAGNPNIVPRFIREFCDDDFYRDRERFVAAQSTRHGVAFIRQASGLPAYGALFAPGRLTDEGVHLIQPQPPGARRFAAAYCED